MGLLDFFSAKGKTQSKSSLGQNSSSSQQSSSTTPPQDNSVQSSMQSNESIKYQQEYQNNFPNKQFSDLTYPLPSNQSLNDYNTLPQLNEVSDLMDSSMEPYTQAQGQNNNSSTYESQLFNQPNTDSNISNLANTEDVQINNQNSNSFGSLTDTTLDDFNNSNKQNYSSNIPKTFQNQLTPTPAKIDNDIIGGQTYITNEGIKATTYQPVEQSQLQTQQENQSFVSSNSQAKNSNFEQNTTDKDLDDQMVTFGPINVTETPVVSEPKVSDEYINLASTDFNNDQIVQPLLNEPPTTNKNIDVNVMNSSINNDDPINEFSKSREIVNQSSPINNNTSEENSSNLHTELMDNISLNNSLESKKDDIKAVDSEKESSYKNILTLNIFKRIAIVGLNNTSINSKLNDKMRELISLLAASLDEIILDSNKGYGNVILEEASKTEVKLTGVYLKPTYSNFSDESEVGINLKNYTSVIYSNFLERLKFLIKESDMFIVPETSGLNNFSELFTLLSIQYLYYGQNKPVILIGKDWLNIYKVFKENFKFAEDQLKSINICSTAEEASTLIKQLDIDYSKKQSPNTKKVIDKREENDEKEFFL